MLPTGYAQVLPHAVDPAAAGFFPLTAPDGASELPGQAGSQETVGRSTAEEKPAAAEYCCCQKC